MTLSVNTNVGAMAALQTLNATNRSLETTQGRINTGLNVASTKDDSAKYTIAQKLRGDLGGLDAVESSLNNAKSVMDVAISGAEQLSDLLNKMKALAVQSADADDTSKDQIDKDYQAYIKQVDNIIKSSGFNGTNLLSSDAAAGGGGAVSAIISLQGGDTATGDWSLNKLDVANQALDTGVYDVISATAIDSGGDTDAALTALDTAFDTLQTSLSDLGSASRRVDDQLTFTGKLSDTIESGIGNLVDADLAKESANLQALQVKQQLGTQALSIANQAPAALLSLFR